jgi:hypothetical protein
MTRQNDILMLAMELRAIRDRVVADLDAALAKVERALPPPAETDRTREMAGWGRVEWREFLDGRRQ